MDLVTLRSRPCCSHRFRHGPSALPRRVARWRANDLFTDFSATTPSSPADRVLREQLLRLPPPRLPRCLYASQSRPARSPPAVNLFHLRTTVRTRSFNARRRRSSLQDLGITFPSFMLVVGHHIAIGFSPPTSHVFAHAALGPRLHRRSHPGDFFFQLVINGFTSG